MSKEQIIKKLKALIEHLPQEWVELTTHRLDIYDESQAKSQFLAEFAKLSSEEISTESLEELPTAFDYVRLGHQLSSILEWAIAEFRSVPAEQVVSFSSQTMPLLSVLRENQIRGQKTEIFYETESAPLSDLEVLKNVYTYDVVMNKVESISEVPDNGQSTKIFVTNQLSIAPISASQVHMTLHIHRDFGCVMVIENNEGSAETRAWDAVVQHSRRRESIAITPPNTVPMIRELLGENNTSPEKATDNDWQDIYRSIEANTGSAVKAALASSGLSIQYAILMGLIEQQSELYPNKKIKILLPPNCYGGTNDQSRRVAASLPKVEVLDLPVDGGQEMTTSLERVLGEVAEADAVPLILVEIPTNPRVEVPDMEVLKDVLLRERTTPKGKEAVKPVFIVDQTFCPNVKLLGEDNSLAQVQTISFASGSKFPSGGRCTGGYCTGTLKAEASMTFIQKHLELSDNQATQGQIKILGSQLPSMADRIAKAFVNTEAFVSFIAETLPEAKLNFIDPQLIPGGFTPSVFSLDLPTKGATAEEKEAYKRDLNEKLIAHMLRVYPEGTKHCVSYGQLKKSYWTIPATSTQGTTREGDKDYIVRVALPPEIDMNRLQSGFREFCEAHI